MLFGYYNPILAYGEEALSRDAAAAGIDGLLVVDLPPEECATLLRPAQARGLALVPLVAPTSSPARIALAAEVADSFLYYVSLTGVTGALSADFDVAGGRASQIRERTQKPVVVGFGVKTGADVKKLARYADGVVVGSALVTRSRAEPGSRGRGDGGADARARLGVRLARLTQVSCVAGSALARGTARFDVCSTVRSKRGSTRSRERTIEQTLKSAR